MIQQLGYSHHERITTQYQYLILITFILIQTTRREKHVLVLDQYFILWIKKYQTVHSIESTYKNIWIQFSGHYLTTKCDIFLGMRWAARSWFICKLKDIHLWWAPRDNFRKYLIFSSIKEHLFLECVQRTNTYFPYFPGRYICSSNR